MAGLAHITDPNEKRQIARNLQVHAWYMKSIFDANVFDLADFELKVVHGLYRHDGSPDTLTAGSINDLARTGRAITYQVINRRTREPAPEKTFDVAVFIKNFYPFEKLILNYDSYSPSGELAGFITIVVPTIPDNYVGINWANELETVYNGRTLSAGELAEVLGVPRADTSLNTGENGRLDTANLTQIDSRGVHFLRSDAAAAYLRMVEAAAADGITWTITDSYRSYDVQVRIAQPPPAGKGIYGRQYAGGVTGLAAVPGTSKHGWGLAVDLGGGVNVDGSPQNNWLDANAQRFGFYTIPREPWHWEFRGGDGTR